jgi:hypothetical protein
MAEVAHGEEQSTTAPKNDNKSGRENAIAFDVVADKIWRRPEKTYGVEKAGIGLRITNRTSKDLTLHFVDAFRVSLISVADGKEMVHGSILPEFLPAKPVKVGAGKSATVTLPTKLLHTRTSSVCLGLENAGWRYLTQDVPPGKYRLSLLYENKQTDNASWLGKVWTAAVEVEVKPAG